MSPTQPIYEALAAESRNRNRRLGVLTFVLAGFAAAFVISHGMRTIASPTDLMAQTIAGVFALFGLVMAVQPSLRLGPWAARAVAVIAVTSPMLALEGLGHDDHMSYGCMMIIAAGGTFGTILVRVIMGPTRRRFGGAPLMQGVTAAMTAALAVGLCCPMLGGVHLLTHVLGATAIVLLLRPLLLPD